MNLYDCKVGDVVLTGDSYGMSPCVCIKEKHFDEGYKFDVVEFLDLTNGATHLSGCKIGSESLLDKCHYISEYPLSEKELENLKKVWNVC